MTQPRIDPRVTIDRLIQATNAHDVAGIVACFAEDYALVCPPHPARSFRGSEQVRRNWTQILAGVPDLTARLVASAVDGASIWTEWEMVGTRRDQGAFRMRGVFVFGVDDDRIRWGRMFLEPVDEGAADVDATVRALTGVES
jgi:ketosteroid isomerase-like protein